MGRDLFSGGRGAVKQHLPTETDKAVDLPTKVLITDSSFLSKSSLFSWGVLMQERASPTLF